MTTWYQTKDYFYNEIPCQPVEVEKETEKQIVIKGRANAKVSGYGRYFKTKQEVKDYHTQRLKADILRLETQIQDKGETLSKVESWNP